MCTRKLFIKIIKLTPIIKLYNFINAITTKSQKPPFFKS